MSLEDRSFLSFAMPSALDSDRIASLRRIEAQLRGMIAYSDKQTAPLIEIAASLARDLVAAEEELHRRRLASALRALPGRGILAAPAKRGRKQQYSEEWLQAFAQKFTGLRSRVEKEAPGAKISDAKVIRTVLKLTSSVKDRQRLKTIQNLLARGRRLLASRK